MPAQKIQEHKEVMEKERVEIQVNMNLPSQNRYFGYLSTLVEVVANFQKGAKIHFVNIELYTFLHF